MNGQLKDDEISNISGGDYTAEYWEYDSRACRRWNLDPKPTIGISDYACFGDNPILNDDVNGDTIRFRFISDPNKSTSSQIKAFKQFKEEAFKSYVYLKKHNASFILDKLQVMPKTVYLSPTQSKGEVSNYNPNDNTIYWDPNMGITTTSGYNMSPAEALSHEGDHALEYIKHGIKFSWDSKHNIPKFQNGEEKRVINGSEQEVARRLGKLKNKQVTRDELSASSTFTTDSSISSDPKSSLSDPNNTPIIKPKN
jgi:hypothetical protein